MWGGMRTWRQSRTQTRLVLVGAVVLLFGIGSVVWMLPTDDEAVLNGIRADEWALRIFLASSEDPAVVALVEIGPAAIPGIIKAYQGHPNHFRASRLYAKTLAVSPAVIARRLPTRYEPPQTQRKCGMLVALRQIRTKADGLEKFLLQETRSADKSIRMYACEALGLIGYSSPETVGRMKELLQDPSGFVKSMALRSLWRLKKLDDPLLRPVLQTLARDEHDAWEESIHGLALYGLWNLGVAESEQQLASFIESSVIISDVVRCLKEHGASAGVFVPMLAERLSAESNRFMQAQIEEALEAIGDGDAP